MKIHDPDIERQFNEVAALIGYPPDALIFVAGGWGTWVVRSKTHISAETLCWRLHDQALDLFGADAKEQLAAWGITKTNDFGELFYRMAEHGLTYTSEGDSQARFDDVFDFEDHFVHRKFKATNSYKNWTISTMFVATTVAAVAASGFSRSGLDGALYALLSSWFVLIGATCLCLGVSKRASDWLLLISLGIIFLAAGLFAFLTLSI